MSFINQSLMILLVLFAFLGPPASLLWGWCSFTKGFPEPKWRAWLGLASFVGANLLAIGYLFAFLQMGALAEFGAKVNFWLRWSQIALRFAAFIAIAAVISKGRFRWASLLCCLALFCLSAAVYSMR
jgi:hypothetical protein